MYTQYSATEDQATWLRMLECRDSEGASEPVEIPGDVLDALVRKGFVRRSRDGNVALTLGGMRAVALQ